MDAAGQLAQLRQRLGQLRARGAHEQLGLRRVAADLPLDQRELQRQRDQPLLGAVVQVALDAPPLRVGGRDDALARGLQLGQPRGDLGVQLPVLQRHPGRHPDRLDELGVVLERPVVDQHGHALPLAVDRRDRPPGVVGHRHRTSRSVDEAVAVREREQQPGVAQHAGQRGLQLDRADRAQVPEQVRDPRARQSRAQQAREERDRHRDQRARGDPEDELRLLAADELHDEHQREQQQASRSRHPGQERATARCRRRPVASAEHQRGTHGDRDEQHPLQGVQGGRDPRVRRRPAAGCRPRGRT